MKTFYHSGQIGDTIYSLPTIKAMGGGVLVSGLGLVAYESIKPLLEYQPYIFGVKHVSQVDLPKGFINLDFHRYRCRSSKDHIVNQHLSAFGLPDYKDWKDGWIERSPYKYDNFDVVVNVTSRYRDKLFNWGRLIERIHKDKKRILFLGIINEYVNFCEEIKDFKTVSYIRTEDLFKASIVIQNAKEFYGTQSSMLAIRQGLGLSYHMEQSPYFTDCNQYSDRETILNPYTRKLHVVASSLKQIFNKSY